MDKAANEPPSEEPPGPAEREGPEDSTEPRSPAAAAAAVLAKEAAEYAKQADEIASTLYGIVLDAAQKRLPGKESDDVIEMSEYSQEAFEAVTSAQAAAGRAAVAAAKARSAVTGGAKDARTADINAEEARAYRDLAKTAYDEALKIRNNLTEFRLWPRPPPEG